MIQHQNHFLYSGNPEELDKKLSCTGLKKEETDYSSKHSKMGQHQNHFLYSGNPEELDKKFSCMDLKKELDEETDYSSCSEANYEMRLYDLLQQRTSLLDAMENQDNKNLVKSSKSLLKNIKQSHRLQMEYETIFHVVPDPDERTQFKIASKGWHNLLLHQHNRHRAIFNRALSNFVSDDENFPINRLLDRMLANSIAEINSYKQRDMRFPRTAIS